MKNAPILFALQYNLIASLLIERSVEIHLKTGEKTIRKKKQKKKM